MVMEVPRSEAFEILGKIEAIEVIARGRSVHRRSKLWKRYGQGNWRKLKGVAVVRLRDGEVRQAEIHWYEAHGIGNKRIKIKRFLD
jgi:hypothetical protein